MTKHFARPDGTGAQIYFKREDLNHTGAHKINNAIGQALLAVRMVCARLTGLSVFNCARLGVLLSCCFPSF